MSIQKQKRETEKPCSKPVSLAQLKQLMNQEVAPFADHFDQLGKFTDDILKKLAGAGFWGVAIPERFSGSEMCTADFGMLCEAVGGSSFSLLSLLTVHSMVAQTLLKWGTEKQQSNWLPKLANGESIAAFGLSEPNIGSDPKNVEMFAKKEGDSYILNGKKKWISAGQIADLFLVIAQCEDDGPTAFLVDKNTPGVSVSPISGMLGFRAAMLAEVHLVNCRIPQDSLVGGVGFGFSHIVGTALDYGRYCIACGAVGLGQACLTASLHYVNQRKQFGVLLKEHQLIQKMIADMVSEIKASRALCMQAGRLRNEGSPESIIETSTAKYVASKMVNRVASDAVQIHGANGCSENYPVQRYFRDAKIIEIIEGSSQIQQLMLFQYANQTFLFDQE